VLAQPLELGRLAKIQKHPLDHIERRVEHLDLLDDHHYAVRVIQQIYVPEHGPVATDDCDLLIPVGYFSKARLPDLAVTGPDGEFLPVLGRQDRGLATAVFFTSVWEQDHLLPLQSAARAEAYLLWPIVVSLVSRIATELEARATELLAQLRDVVTTFSHNPELQLEVRQAYATMLAEQRSWTILESLAESRMVIAVMRGRPGRTYVVTATYTERFSYEQYGWTPLTKVLNWLALTALSVDRKVANFGRAKSLWIVQTLPPGVEPVRTFWDDRRTSPVDEDTQAVQSDRVVLARYNELADPSATRQVMLDVQMSSSASVTSAALLAVLLLFVSTYIYQQLPGLLDSGSPVDGADGLVGLASVFAAVPAAITAALAYGGQTFVRRLSRGPRALLALLAAQAAFMSILIGLRRADGLVTDSVFALSIYSFFVMGLYGYIRLGPRWRKNARSRIKWRTEPVSPDECRRRQMRSAIVALAVWVLATIVFARSQILLRQEHFFTDQFPANIWRAWWSWFGLTDRP
jgi:hypothetical protein